MKIRLGPIAAWIGRAIVSALVSEAADRLSRSKPVRDRADQGRKAETADQSDLRRE